MDKDGKSRRSVWLSDDGKSVREVAATHGNISFKDVLLFHREE